LPSLRDIRSRIRSVRDIQQITRAMKMVAAAKLRRAERAMEAAHSYSQELDGLAVKLLARRRLHPLLEPGEGPRLLVLFSSDKGLCGGFNAQAVRAALAEIREHAGRGEGNGGTRVVAIGRQGAAGLLRAGVEVERVERSFFDGFDYGTSEEFSSGLARQFESGEAGEVVCVYPTARGVEVEGLLPVALEPAGEAGVEYLFEPDEATVLDAALRQRTHMRFFAVATESEAAEYRARMLAMDAASTNAGELIESLTLDYHRARQSAITKEILEIAGGAEALRGG